MYLLCIYLYTHMCLHIHCVQVGILKLCLAVAFKGEYTVCAHNATCALNRLTVQMIYN